MIKYTAEELALKNYKEIQAIAKSLDIKSNSATGILVKAILAKQGNSTQKNVFFENNANNELTQPSEKPVDKISINKISIDTFFIQINKSNLLGYFACALIHPVNYETRDLAHSQRTKDIQHFSPNHLLISDGFTDELNEQQVLIEVTLTDFDKKELIRLNEKIYLLSYSLPISRVTKIYFASKDSQDNSIATANTFQDAFLPTHLFQIWNEKIENRINLIREIQPIQIPANKQLKIDNQHHFDRVLGMLAFMKNAELYYANTTHKLAIYSDKYLELLKQINPFFDKSEIETLDSRNSLFFLSFIKHKSIVKKDILQKIVHAIYNNEIFRKDIFKQILGTPDEVILKAFQLLVNDKTLDALKSIDELKPAAPELIVLALLFRFRDKEGSDKYALKEQLPDLINMVLLKKFSKTINRASIILAALGLYYGYRSLPKNEEIKLNDRFFASFGENGKFNIKYKLDNLLDRITIESVYQYCFWDNQKNDFNFLKDDNPVIKYKVDEGYSAENTFFIIDNYPIVRIAKLHSKMKQEVKKQTVSKFNSFMKFINCLKKNGLVQAEVNFYPAEFDIWLHNNSSSELESILAEINAST